jgi:Tfp pilus assembly protein PilO
MKRTTLLLAILAAALIVALFYLLLFQPQRDALAEVEEQIAMQEQQQLTLERDLARLRSIREGAPEVESHLAASLAVIPREPALPAALRQLQLSADESGVTLQSVTTARPAQVTGAAEGLSSIAVTTQIQGSYFQLVDYLRRIEDPSITPRGLLWQSASVSRGEYPVLNLALTADMFVHLSHAAPAADDEDTAADGQTDADVELEPGGEEDL